MRTNISSVLTAALFAVFFLISGSAVGFANDCDVKAYVTDKDRTGMNVRDTPDKNGQMMGLVPFDKGGTMVHIVSQASSGNGWVQIDKAQTFNDKIVFSGFGWVSGNLLSIGVRSTTDGVKLYEWEKGSKVLTRIPMENEVKVVGCEEKRAMVKYKSFTGWLEPEDQCVRAEGVCN